MNQPVQNPYRFLFRRLVIWFRGSFNFLWLFLVAAYLMVLAGHAFYRNYQAQQETAALQTQLKQGLVEKDRLEALLVYYKTDSFKEKELRRTLLLKGKDEKVYALPESSVSKTVEEAISEGTQTAKKAPSTDSIVSQWIEYIWDGQKDE